MGGGKAGTERGEGVREAQGEVRGCGSDRVGLREGDTVRAGGRGEVERKSEGGNYKNSRWGPSR